MSRQVRLVIASFSRGMVSLGAGWDWSVRPSSPIRHGIKRHFASIGERLNAAANRFAESHPEIKSNA